MKLKQIIVFCAAITAILFSNVLATTYNDVANNTTDYVISNTLVQSAARGFVFFTKGAIFENKVNVSLPAPIMGQVQFGNRNTSKIYLESDVTLGSTAGTITNSLRVTTTTGYAEIVGANGTIRLNGDTFLPSYKAFRILDNLTIDGCGHDIIFDFLTTFTILSGKTLTIRDANLRGLRNLNFVGSGTLALHNTVITLDYDWTYSGNALFGTPALRFEEDNLFRGVNRSFIYAGGRDLTLAADAMVTFDIGTTFSWASKRRNGFIMGESQNDLPGYGAYLVFNNSSFAVPSRGTNNGLYIQSQETEPGAIIFENNCNIYNDGNTNVNKSLQYDNAPINVLSGAQIALDGYLYDSYNQSTGGEVYFHPTQSPYNVYTFDDTWTSSYPLLKTTFSIAADRDAMLVISEQKNVTSGNSIVRTVTIGGYTNTNFIFRKGDIDQSGDVPSLIGSAPILSGVNTYAQFWLTYDQVSGICTIGRGTTIDENLLVKWTDTTPLTAKTLYVAFGGWINGIGAIVYWKNIKFIEPFQLPDVLKVGNLVNININKSGYFYEGGDYASNWLIVRPSATITSTLTQYRVVNTEGNLVWLSTFTDSNMLLQHRPQGQTNAYIIQKTGVGALSTHATIPAGRFWNNMAWERLEVIPCDNGSSYYIKTYPEGYLRIMSPSILGLLSTGYRLRSHDNGYYGSWQPATRDQALPCTFSPAPWAPTMLPPENSVVAIKSSVTGKYVTVGGETSTSTNILLTNLESTLTTTATRFTIKNVNAEKGTFQLMTHNGWYVQSMVSCIIANQNATPSTIGTLLNFDGTYIFGQFDPTDTTVWYPATNSNATYVANTASYAGWAAGTNAYWQTTPYLRNHDNQTKNPGKWSPGDIANGAEQFTFEMIRLPTPTTISLPAEGSTVAIKNVSTGKYVKNGGEMDLTSTKVLTLQGTASSDSACQFIIKNVNEAKGTFKLVANNGWLVQSMVTAVITNQNATLISTGTTLYYDGTYISGRYDPTDTMVWYSPSWSNYTIATDTASKIGWIAGVKAYWKSYTSPAQSLRNWDDNTIYSGKWSPGAIGKGAEAFVFEVVAAP